MAKAGVGVRRELVELLVALLNAGVHPIVRMVGSVGQGDLSEMADIGKVLIGRGCAEYRGETLPGAEALRRAGIEPITLGPKEALGADQRQRRDDGPRIARARRRRRPRREHADRGGAQLRGVRAPTSR